MYGAATDPATAWGDVSHLVDIMDVRPIGDDVYRGGCRADQRRPVVEGSQMLGQAIVAAGRERPDRRVVSGQLIMTRVADAREPVDVALSPVSDGRTFTTFAVDVSQDGRSRAVGHLLVDVGAPDVIRHAVAAPDVGSPDDATPFDMGVVGRELRIVDAAYTDDPDAPIGPPTIDAWVRFDGLSDDSVLHAGLLAQFTGHMSIAAAMRPHVGVGQRDAHNTLSTAINAITISLHAPIRADRWMLYHHDVTFAGDGMTHATCRVHDEDGDLLASFGVDAMVRAMNLTDIDTARAL